MIETLAQHAPELLGGGSGGAIAALLWMQLRKARKALAKIQEIADTNIQPEEKISRIRFVLLWARSEPTVPEK